MGYERRPDRRGGRPGGGRQDRPPRDRGAPGGFGDRPPRDRGGFGDRPPRDRGGFDAEARPRPGGFRRDDDGGMSIRLDPRRLSALKLLAAESGVRPGELVTSWVEERIDAARAGKSVAAAAAPAAIAELTRRVDELARRLDDLAGAGAGTVSTATLEPSGATVAGAAPAKRGPGRPRKPGSPSDAGQATPEAAEEESPPADRAPSPASARVPLHEEIAAVITERGPLSAAEIAIAIAERGRYSAPRSGKPLDAAMVNGRVSNPAYRARFRRDGGRIGLADG